MKLFTIQEANELIPKVRPILKEISDNYTRLLTFREEAAKASNTAAQSGGIAGGSHYLNLIFEINKAAAKIDAMKIQLKDYSAGLIDFPCLMQDKIVLLCWKLGEDDFIEWWHETDAGFAGRKPL